jgi:hypothetical protein
LKENFDWGASVAQPKSDEKINEKTKDPGFTPIQGKPYLHTKENIFNATYVIKDSSLGCRHSMAVTH